MLTRRFVASVLSSGWLNFNGTGLVTFTQPVTGLQVGKMKSDDEGEESDQGEKDDDKDGDDATAATMNKQKEERRQRKQEFKAKKNDVKLQCKECKQHTFKNSGEQMDYYKQYKFMARLSNRKCARECQHEEEKKEEELSKKELKMKKRAEKKQKGRAYYQEKKEDIEGEKKEVEKKDNKPTTPTGAAEKAVYWALAAKDLSKRDLAKTLPAEENDQYLKRAKEVLSSLKEEKLQGGEDTKMTCDTCGKTMGNFADWANHVAKHHKKEFAEMAEKYF